MTDSIFNPLATHAVRSWYLLLISWSVAAMLLAVFYFQHHLGLEPCYLCVTQRFFVVAIGVVAALGLLFKPSSALHTALHCGVALLAAGGAGFSIKQLWLQSLPVDQVPVCGPPVDYLFEAFPASEIITMLMQGDGNCAEVKWQLLGLSMPGWVLLMFIAVLATAAWRLWNARRLP